MFDDILHRKTAFLDLKKTLILKTRNKCIFPRGLVHGFGKNELKFFHFIIYEIHQRKCYLLLPFGYYVRKGGP